jgi:hypothetical protein
MIYLVCFLWWPMGILGLLCGLLLADEDVEWRDFALVATVGLLGPIAFGAGLYAGAKIWREVS